MDRHEKFTRNWAALLLGVAIVISLVALCTNINGPVLDSYGFRQTQTAISAYYIALGGPIFSYETPVFGPPWAIPFEFPTIQILAAALHFVGVPLDAAGRLVSYFFYVACLIPIYFLTKAANLPRNSFWVMGALFMAAPIHLFWGRTFLIETGALFFSLCWLAVFITVLKHTRATLGSVVLALLAGCMAALTKSTTFIPVVLFAFFWFVPVAARRYASGGLKEMLRIACIAAGITLIPLLVGLGWVMWSDSLKTANEMGAMLTSKALLAWNFGSLEQRFSPLVWAMFENRSLKDVFGTVPYIAIASLGVYFAKPGYRWFASCCIAVTIGTLLILTNLHFVHSYYLVSIAVFAIFPVAIAVAQLDKVPAAILLVLLMASQVFHFYGEPNRLIQTDHSLASEYRIAIDVAKLTNPGDVILVIGHDWDSTIPYYSQRRSQILPDWAPQKQFDDKLAQARSYGAVVLCNHPNEKVIAARATLLSDGFSEIQREDRCAIYR